MQEPALRHTKPWRNHRRRAQQPTLAFRRNRDHLRQPWAGVLPLRWIAGRSRTRQRWTLATLPGPCVRGTWV